MKIEQGNPQNPKKKANQKKNTFLIAVIAAVAVILVIACIFIVKNLSGDGEKDPSSSNSSSSTSSTSSVSSTVSSEPDDEEELYEGEFDPDTGILVDFVDIYEEYPDFIGHISIPGTLLDSDVAHGADNAFYLDHKLDGSYDAYGTPFLDWRGFIDRGLQSTILTIYGHNSVHGDYFEAVKSYKDIDFYKENPILYFDSIYGKGTYKILGVFTEYVYGDFFNYHDYIDLDEETFNKYMSEVDKRNYYDSGIDVKYGDKIIALSTCNDEIQGPLNTPYRDVLVARKVRAGEDEEINVDNIKPNEDVVMPDGWKVKFGKENPYK